MSYPVWASLCAESSLLAWSQLLECRRGLELCYRPTQRLEALPLPDPGRADNGTPRFCPTLIKRTCWPSSAATHAIFPAEALPLAAQKCKSHRAQAGAGPSLLAVGVALVRRCFPFGAQGTALFGHPTLRYFEVAILAPEEETNQGGSSSSSSAGSIGDSMGPEPEDALEAAVQQQLDGPSSPSGGSSQASSGSSLAATQPGAEDAQQEQLCCGVSIGVVESKQAHSMLSNGLHLG